MAPVEADIVFEYFPPVVLMSSWQSYLAHTANLNETVSVPPFPPSLPPSLPPPFPSHLPFNGKRHEIHLSLPSFPLSLPPSQAAEAKQGAVKELVGKLTKMALVGASPDKIMEIVKDFTVTVGREGGREKGAEGSVAKNRKGGLRDLTAQ